VEVELHAFFISALYGDELPVFFGLEQFTAGERAPQITAQLFWMFYIEKSNTVLWMPRLRIHSQPSLLKVLLPVQNPRVSKIPISRHSAIVTIIISPPPLTQRKLNV